MSSSPVLRFTLPLLLLACAATLLSACTQQEPQAAPPSAGATAAVQETTAPSTPQTPPTPTSGSTTSPAPTSAPPNSPAPEFSQDSIRIVSTERVSDPAGKTLLMTVRAPENTHFSLALPSSLERGAPCTSKILDDKVVLYEVRCRPASHGEELVGAITRDGFTYSFSRPLT